MNNALIFTLRDNLNELIKAGTLEGRFIVLFGMNTPGDEVINYLARKDIKVDGIVDNNILNKGKKLAGVTVYTPEELLGDYRSDVVILICSRYFSEMASQLEQMGYDRNTQIYKVLEMGGGSELSTDEETFLKKSKMYKVYADIVNRILSKCGEDARIVAAPVKANGDVYILSSMLDAYGKRTEYNIWLAVVGQVGRKIASMHGINNIIVVTQEEMDALVGISRFLGSESSRVEIVQPYYMYTSVLPEMEGYKGITFRDMYMYGYELADEDKVKKYPDRTISDEELMNYVKENSIEEGKSIIIAPYANSLPQIRWSAWKAIVDGLKIKGYKVYTNSASDEEEAVEGSEKIFFPIKDTVEVLNYAGGFIAMRNGMCEIASTSECRQVIIYPDKAARFGKIINTYGIKSMGIGADNIYEIEDCDDIVEKVLGVF